MPKARSEDRPLGRPPHKTRRRSTAPGHCTNPTIWVCPRAACARRAALIARPGSAPAALRSPPPAPPASCRPWQRPLGPSGPLAAGRRCGGSGTAPKAAP
ncbi:hypothetical protein RirG_010740 [Rhizophagus irregularis DAOM 197198w]|uniref:Uncharacterized protein n=1 Tax=Rhizophagus irregularis (strain DAOM 197198w) TaxID=1432141 RepID=A0A015M1M8_RHIIW|nr:hypothetical protein RirG_010740 [Rhizophagus irregularis DAOM 197198w]